MDVEIQPAPPEHAFDEPVLATPEAIACRRALVGARRRTPVGEIDVVPTSASGDAEHPTADPAVDARADAVAAEIEAIAATATVAFADCDGSCGPFAPTRS